MNMVDRRRFCLGLGALSGLALMPSAVRAEQIMRSGDIRHPVEPAKEMMTAAQRAERMAWWEQDWTW